MFGWQGRRGPLASKQLVGAHAAPLAIPGQAAASSETRGAESGVQPARWRRFLGGSPASSLNPPNPLLSLQGPVQPLLLLPRRQGEAVDGPLVAEETDAVAIAAARPRWCPGAGNPPPPLCSRWCR